ncbi:MAG TPA: adenine deaminase [Chitinophagaceae bacterium]|nr:adenine deaminase [Chitinophagaceae bacterium]
MEFSLVVNLVDIVQKQVFPVAISVENGVIRNILRIDPQPDLPFMLPGFIDAHVHIESSMLVPAQFARLAVVHGTVATVSDPHEIANVCGLPGVDFMIKNGKSVPFKFFFGAPSCVPATDFETAGAHLDPADIEYLLKKDDIKYLSEMMNFPGVLGGAAEVMKKIQAAVNQNKPVDGHAPGLRGHAAQQYIEAGSGDGSVVISTDHECFTKEEALDKLKFGMKIIIREGSAAKNFEALIELLPDYPDHIMFCSDDKHPDSLVKGHINELCKRAVAKGIDVFHVLKAACLNPVFHYNLDVGLLKEGDPADFIVVRDLKNFEVLQTFVKGEKVAENGRTLIEAAEHNERESINNFSVSRKFVEDFEWAHNGADPIPAIEALDGQLITNKIAVAPSIKKGLIVGDLKNDILKIVVVNRYADAQVSKGLIKNFGLKQGALASSVAHDSHNIVAVGVDDESICQAVNLVIASRGGVCCVKDNLEMVLPLPVAGLMSAEDGYRVAELYSLIDKAAKEAGSKLSAPFMTLSFMALLVIPHLKLSDQGLFDGDTFQFV